MPSSTHAQAGVARWALLPPAALSLATIAVSLAALLRMPAAPGPPAIPPPSPAPPAAARPPAVPPTPTPTPMPAPEGDARVAALLEEAARFAARNDWSVPEGACALARYLEVLRLAPGHPDGEAGVQSVIDFFVHRGDELRGEPQAARIRYQRALELLAAPEVRTGLRDAASTEAEVRERLNALPGP